MSEPKIAVVVGLPGVGKSTVLSIAKDMLEAKGYGVEILNFGTEMLEYLKKKGIVQSRDEIRRLPLRVQQEAQAGAAAAIREKFEELAEKYEKFIGFVDTHAIIKTPSGIWPGLPLHVMTNLRPHTIIVVEADPDVIVARQLRDKTRHRADYADVRLVKELLSYVRQFSIASAVLVGASVNFIINEEGKAEEAAAAVTSVIENI